MHYIETDGKTLKKPTDDFFCMHFEYEFILRTIFVFLNRISIKNIYFWICLSMIKREI